MTASPVLYVEGPDDISAISALLKRHGVDTKQGKQHLKIESTGGVENLLPLIPDAVKNSRDFPCGFVLDIDTVATHRWASARDRLCFDREPSIKLMKPLPPDCFIERQPGYIGQIAGYRHPFGVWLMPDCRTDGQKLEDLIATLVPAGHPLREHARTSTAEAVRLVREANDALPDEAPRWGVFKEPDRIKAEVRAWLAWQEEPGQGIGAAITAKVLRDDSPQALAFMGWLSRLFGFRFPVLESPPIDPSMAPRRIDLD